MYLENSLIFIFYLFFIYFLFIFKKEEREMHKKKKDKVQNKVGNTLWDVPPITGVF